MQDFLLEILYYVKQYRYIPEFGAIFSPEIFSNVRMLISYIPVQPTSGSMLIQAVYVVDVLNILHKHYFTVSDAPAILAGRGILRLEMRDLYTDNVFGADSAPVAFITQTMKCLTGLPPSYRTHELVKLVLHREMQSNIVYSTLLHEFMRDVLGIESAKGSFEAFVNTTSLDDFRVGMTKFADPSNAIPRFLSCFRERNELRSRAEPRAGTDRRADVTHTQRKSHSAVAASLTDDRAGGRNVRFTHSSQPREDGRASSADARRSADARGGAGDAPRGGGHHRRGRLSRNPHHSSGHRGASRNAGSGGGRPVRTKPIGVVDGPPHLHGKTPYPRALPRSPRPPFRGASSLTGVTGSL